MPRDLETLKREHERQSTRLEVALGALEALARAEGDRVVRVDDDVMTELEALTVVAPRRGELPLHPFSLRG